MVRPHETEDRSWERNSGYLVVMVVASKKKVMPSLDYVRSDVVVIVDGAEVVELAAIRPVQTTAAVNI